MAEYKAIHGTLFQSKTSDPLAAGVAGGSWSTGGALNRGNSVSIVGAGATNTAVIGAGGNVGGPPYSDVTNTESYNGSSWTEVNDLNTARNQASGTSSAPYASALYHGGGPVGVTSNESWNGTAWTETGDLNTARTNHMGAGASNTSAITAGGETTPRPPAQSVNAETWDGSSWTEVANINDTRRHTGGLGTATAALLLGGDNDPGLTDSVEEWNGSSWTEITDLNTTRAYIAGCGTTTEGLAIGGRTPSKTGVTENWNGSSWTEIADLATARAGFTGAGVATSNLFAGGETATAYTTATEEFNTAGATDTLQNNGQAFYRSDTGDFKISLTQFGTGAWASGGNVNTARSVLPGFGQSHNAAIIVGGDAGPSGGGDSCDKVENYNGTSWTEIAEINTGNANAGAFGTTTAGLRCGGMPSTVNAHTGNTETWNGSAWTEVNNLNTAGSDFMTSCSGSQTAGLAPPRANVEPGTHSNISVTESWDGTSWTEIVDPNVNKRLRGGTGSAPQTSTMIFGGGYPRDGATEIFNGTSWTEVGDLNTVRTDVGGAGNSISIALAFGGRASPGPTVITEQWNGSSWTEVGDQSNGNTFYFAGAGVATSAIRATGAHVTNNPSHTNVTEEWTIPESISNLTITD